MLSEESIDLLIPPRDWESALGGRKTKVYADAAAGLIQLTKVGRRTFVTTSEARRYRAAHAKPFVPKVLSTAS